ncbi:MAG: hypothetical protein K9I37_08365 [Crocinitomicaceae bacterium]|jgi:hypothetical protein|nr:hypothetical protein [Crocinitomicaceae bacterium]
MTQVSNKSIEKAIEHVDNLDDDALEALSERYALAQPDLLDYVMSAPTEYENDELEGLLIYYFCLIMYSFEVQDIALNVVSDDDIDAMQESYFEMLDSYFETEDEEEIESFCDQPDLAQFMAVEVSTDDEDGTSLSEETASQLFIVTIGMISLINKAIKA